jgi:hypothetical protein
METNYVSICIGGAPLMVGCRGKEYPVVTTHCFFRKEMVVSETLEMK